MFDVAGMGTKKLGDVVQGVAKDAVERHAAKLELAQKGLRPATSAERYVDHQKEVGNNLIVAGIPGQQAIYVEALHHVTEMQDSGMSRAAIKEHEMKLLNEDPARYHPYFLRQNLFVHCLEIRKLSEMKSDSEDFKFLSTRLNQLVMDAGSSLNTHVEGVQEQAEAKLTKEASKPGTKRTLEFYKAKVMASLAKDPAAAKMVKPEQIEKMAQQRMAKDQIKAAALAEKRLTQNPVKKATSIALREKPVPAIKVRTAYTKDRFGQPAVRYDINPDYNVYLRKHMATAKSQGKTLTEFFKDMSDEDFKDDLSKHFYPKGLQKAGVFFEHQNTREGTQNPNFLAFMYNYTHLMPREFGKNLSNGFSTL